MLHWKDPMVGLDFGSLMKANITSETTEGRFSNILNSKINVNNYCNFLDKKYLFLAISFKLRSYIHVNIPSHYANWPLPMLPKKFQRHQINGIATPHTHTNAIENLWLTIRTNVYDNGI